MIGDGRVAAARAAFSSIVVGLALVSLGCSKGSMGDVATSDAAAPADAAVAVVAAAADAGAPPGPRFVGRFVPEPGGGMRFAWSGSAVTARFRGTAIAARLRDEGPSSYQIVLDGDASRVVHTEVGRERSYVLAENLTPGVHEVTLYRRTEARVGETVFLGFEPGAGGELLGPPAAPARRIELVGDSITTGFGDEGRGPYCGFVPNEENAYITYGALAARALAADHVIVAGSGKTVHEMTEYFDKPLPARADLVWDFAQAPQPDVVVIDVGTNNFANVDPGQARFVTLYTALVQRVRAAYPKAFIVCALGPMLSDVYPEKRRSLTQARKYMRAALADLKEAGDANVEMIEFPEQNHADGLGCAFHPSPRTHARMAEQLVAFLRQRLGW